MEKYISGVIFHDETLSQLLDGDKNFTQYCISHGIIPGIKVDKGLLEVPSFENEKMTLGLDGLQDRLHEYKKQGIGFAKWRAVFSVEKSSQEVIELNATQLSLYASLCQNTGIVPIVEPEVLYEGDHTLEACEAAIERVLDILFKSLTLYRVDIPGVILKTSMVLSGKTSGEIIPKEEVAKAVVRILSKCVPKNIGGIVFLSGGQTPVQATENLNEIQKKYYWN